MLFISSRKEKKIGNLLVNFPRAEKGGNIRNLWEFICPLFTAEILEKEKAKIEKILIYS